MENIKAADRWLKEGALQVLPFSKRKYIGRPPTYGYIEADTVKGIPGHWEKTVRGTPFVRVREKQ